jgi:hypothetical protein
MVSKGLAWFSHQIPTEGFSDLDQGRLGKTEIPHSDQWIGTIGQSNGSYRPDEFNRKNTMIDKNGRGVSKILVEDIYSATECFEDNGIHNAKYENGKYVYDSPANWANAATKNRTIALRRCQILARAYYVTITFEVDYPDETEYIEYECDANIAAEDSMSDALQIIARAMQKATAKRSTFWSVYDNVKCEGKIGINGENTKFRFKEANQDFTMLFNDDNGDMILYWKHTLTIGTLWNRKDLFIHASFASNTAGGYRCRDGEFYTSPSKQYKVEYPISTFYLETSFNGVDKAPLPYENWFVELSFIIDVEDYY